MIDIIGGLVHHWMTEGLPKPSAGTVMKSIWEVFQIISSIEIHQKVLHPTGAYVQHLQRAWVLWPLMGAFGTADSSIVPAPLTPSDI